MGEFHKVQRASGPGSDPSLCVESPLDLYGTENSILLATEAVRLIADDVSILANATVCFRLLPRPQIEIKSSFGSKQHFFMAEKITAVFLADREVPMPGFQKNLSSQMTIGESPARTLTWVVNEPVNILYSDEKEITSVAFHILNFSNFHSKLGFSEVQDRIEQRIDCLSLEWKDYQFLIRSLSDTTSTLKKLKSDGGYGVTHIGRLRKKSSGPIQQSEALEILHQLGLVLSFANGAWSVPTLCIGYDSHENKVWSHWSTPKGDPFSGRNCWLDPFHPEHVTDFFPRFLDLKAHEHWGSCLHDVLYWYLNSNFSARGIDAGLILTQTALEKLAHTHKVLVQGTLSRSSFKKMGASTKIKTLLEEFRIPIDIPDSMTDFLQLAAQRNWKDGPEAIVDIRNDLVHPERHGPSPSTRTLYDAWNLGLWYVEMALFAICGYDGEYSNRLVCRHEGEVTPVPWKIQRESS